MFDRHLVAVMDLPPSCHHFDGLHRPGNLARLRRPGIPAGLHHPSILVGMHHYRSSPVLGSNHPGSLVAGLDHPHLLVARPAH